MEAIFYGPMNTNPRRAGYICWLPVPALADMLGRNFGVCPHFALIHFLAQVRKFRRRFPPNWFL
jgi:hypothetical protein